MKIRSTVALLFHADGQTERQTDGRTDMTKLTVDFCSFANAAVKKAIRPQPLR